MLSTHPFYSEWHSREIEDQARVDVHGFHIGPNDRKMNRLQVLDGFEFNHQSAGNQQIQPVLSNRFALIGQSDAFLPLERNISTGQLDAECLLIKGLKETGTESFVDLNGCVDNA